MVVNLIARGVFLVIVITLTSTLFVFSQAFHFMVPNAAILIARIAKPSCSPLPSDDATGNIKCFSQEGGLTVSKKDNGGGGLRVTFLLILYK